MNETLKSSVAVTINDSSKGIQIMLPHAGAFIVHTHPDGSYSIEDYYPFMCHTYTASLPIMEWNVAGLTASMPIMEWNVAGLTTCPMDEKEEETIKIPEPIVWVEYYPEREI